MVQGSPFIHQTDRVARKVSDVSAADWRYQTCKKMSYHINCGVIQGFPGMRKAVTTHVKKYRIFSRMLK